MFYRRLITFIELMALLYLIYEVPTATAVSAVQWFSQVRGTLSGGENCSVDVAVSTAAPANKLLGGLAENVANAVEGLKKAVCGETFTEGDPRFAGAAELVKVVGPLPGYTAGDAIAVATENVGSSTNCTKALATCVQATTVGFFKETMPEAFQRAMESAGNALQKAEKAENVTLKALADCVANNSTMTDMIAALQNNVTELGQTVRQENAMNIRLQTALASAKTYLDTVLNQLQTTQQSLQTNTVILGSLLGVSLFCLTGLLAVHCRQRKLQPSPQHQPLP